MAAESCSCCQEAEAVPTNEGPRAGSGIIKLPSWIQAACQSKLFGRSLRQAGPHHSGCSAPYGDADAASGTSQEQPVITKAALSCCSLCHSFQG